MDVLGMVSIFTYGFDLSFENFRQANINYISLSDYSILIEVAIKHNIISEDQVERLQSWRHNPELWD